MQTLTGAQTKPKLLQKKIPNTSGAAIFPLSPVFFPGVELSVAVAVALLVALSDNP